MQLVRMQNLCFTNQTLYAVDEQGYVWFINMKNGEWTLHGNPTLDDRAKELNRLEGKHE